MFTVGFSVDAEHVYGLSWSYHEQPEQTEKEWLDGGRSAWSDDKWYAVFESEQAWKKCMRELYDLNYPSCLDSTLKEHAVSINSTWEDDE